MAGEETLRWELLSLFTGLGHSGWLARIMTERVLDLIEDWEKSNG